MGTKVAPSYANIFMSHLEEKYVYSHDNQPLLWKRFIDDMFLIWTHAMDKLMQFITHLNQSHSTIIFTSETSDIKMPF